ncbi:hypothetical protein QBC35DRAFT_372309 [Podospora australis]|uniref:Ubiquitin-protein ligase Sel1/Ubx2 n=1 Tax=Podospora australis TaxID=1536484 RepID=A0AAN7AN71_9PEZI|nr:hypothetical protein QBC35DRAFT_372309 [Podospora australis]
MRKYIFWLFLLLQAVAFSYAEAQTDQHVLSDDASRGTNDHVFPADVASAQPTAGVREPGADLVDSAMTELRKLYQPLHSKARRHQGVITALLNLAAKAVPTLRLTAPPTETSTPKPAVSGPLLHATKLLEESASKNNSDALYILAEMNFYGNYSYPRNFKASFDYYHRLALLNGNSSALYMLGLMYSTGIGGAVEEDQARALLYYTFAANRGHTRAEMSVAYRHHAGIGTPKSCEPAVKYYKRVADKAIAWYRSGPPGGMGWIPEAYRISDEAGGAYGEGASYVSSGPGATKSDASSLEDIIEYLNVLSDKGDFKASFNLGRIFYQGQRGLDKDYAQARKYFMDIAQKYWVKGGRPGQTLKPELDKNAAKSAGYLGRMYLRGEGVAQDFNRAKFWFERGEKLRDAQSQFGLALLYRYGYGVDIDLPKATSLLKAAADQNYHHAQVQLGALYLDQGTVEDIAAASHNFELASRWANIESYYYLAELYNLGVGREKSCNSALRYYKSLSEQAEPFVSSWAEANLAYEGGDLELALLQYLGAAEQGYEHAQNNVAYILDPDQSRLPIPDWLYRRPDKSSLLKNTRLALIEWTRSARQGNIDALVKMGDYYLYGIGADADVNKAVQCYQGASEYMQSAQAMYNLGWMHENGVGLEQDYHLAKRHYDSALAINTEAYLPVTLSLLKLRARSAWNTITRGRINSIQDEPGSLLSLQRYGFFFHSFFLIFNSVEKKEWSLKEWIKNFLQDEGGPYFDDYYDEYLDEENHMPGGDGATVDEGDDDLLESAAIIGLMAALAFLVMYRNQRQQRLDEARRRQEEEEARRQRGIVDPPQQPVQQQPQQPEPLPPQQHFPQPGGPEWAVGGGGIGH